MMIDKRTKDGKKVAEIIGLIKLTFWAVVIWGLYTAVYWIGTSLGLIDPGSWPSPYPSDHE